MLYVLCVLLFSCMLCMYYVFLAVYLIYYHNGRTTQNKYMHVPVLNYHNYVLLTIQLIYIGSVQCSACEEDQPNQQDHMYPPLTNPSGTSFAQRAMWGLYPASSRTTNGWVVDREVSTS